LSYNNTLRENILNDTKYSFSVWGEHNHLPNLTYYLHSIETSNLVNGKPVFYLVNKTDLMMNPTSHPQVGYLAFINCNNMTVEGLTLNNNVDGLLIAFTNRSKITNNTITNNRNSGVKLVSSHHNVLSGNCIIENQDTPVTTDGIYIHMSFNNTFSANQISFNGRGIRFGYNYISANNTFFHNLISNGLNEVYIPTGEYRNYWDNGVEGNFWTNIWQYPDQNNDGIVDTPFVINVNNTDRYPLRGVFSSFETASSYRVDIISNSTIEDFEHFPLNGTIRIYVSNMFPPDFQTAGFCRVSIPKDLISPPLYVSINDGAVEVFHFNNSILDNGTHRWLFFAYKHSTYKVDIVPEFPSLVILPFSMFATVLAAVVYRRKEQSHACN